MVVTFEQKTELKYFCNLPEVGEELRFEQQISDVSYADVPNYFLLWPLYNWKATDLMISHPLESFKNQFIALDANDLVI